MGTFSDHSRFFKTKFSYSIFLICLFDFLFWTYASVPVVEPECDQQLQSYLTTQSCNFNQYDLVQDRIGQEEKLQESSELEKEVVYPGRESVKSKTENTLTDFWGYKPAAFLFGGISSVLLLLLFPLSRSRNVRRAAELLLHPSELLLLLKYKFIYSKKITFPKNVSPSASYCYEKLVHVSRSFAAVILELPEELLESISTFYLALRALDTVEDDMSIPISDKVVELKAFYQHLNEPGWKLSGYGDVPAERDLLEHFYHVQTVFSTLSPENRDIIQDITQRMGEGMAEFAERSVVTVEDYNLYCHYVAGLVGIGLSRLFSTSGLECKEIGALETISNSMGLFLQKTNITRDYHEDINAVNSRMFYPKEIWGKYASSLKDLLRTDHSAKAVHCLNDMITNAVGHISDCIDYLQMLQHPAVFKFCAIPQAMAIATLAKLYNNHDVFCKEVKIRKGEAVSIIMNCTNFPKVCAVFRHYIADIDRRINPSDPNAQLLKKRLEAASEKITNVLENAK